jgi:hypothetical protein
MISYNSYDELNCVAGNEIIEDDNVVIVKNIEKKDNVVDDNRIEDGEKVKCDSLGIDDCSTNIGANWFKCISLMI